MCVCAPVIVEIVSEDDQQRISKLCQSSIIFLNPLQIVKQRMGGKMHLNGSSGDQQLMWRRSSIKVRTPTQCADVGCYIGLLM